MSLGVRIVPLADEHADATFAWLSRPDVRDNLGLRSEPSLEKTRDFIARARTGDDVVALAVLYNNAHVGNVIVDHVDAHAKKARLHVYLGAESVRGQGVGAACVRLALHAAFAKLPIDKVYLTVHAKNLAAIAAYESAGFFREGTLRREFLFRGERLDEIYMGVFESEISGERPKRAAT